jgi:hypothetical protein
VTPGGFGLSGPHAGRGWEFSRASSALPRSEARFELLYRARLRAVFGGRWAVPSWPDPTYQTRKSAKIWGEMRNSLSAHPTKHALRKTIFTGHGLFRAIALTGRHPLRPYALAELRWSQPEPWPAQDLYTMHRWTN